MTNAAMLFRGTVRWERLGKPSTAKLAYDRAEEFRASSFYYGELRSKYADAARRLWLPVAPDPPEPK